MQPPLPNSFDPYRDWLGITPDEQPPHHYRLLGLNLFEVHPGTISAAADRQAKLLKDHLHGPRGQLAQQVLAELQAAQSCLFNPAAKQAYDAELVRQLTPAEQAVQPHPGLAAGNAGGVITPGAFLPMGSALGQSEPAADTMTSMEATDPAMTVGDAGADSSPAPRRPVRRRRRQEPSMLSHLIGVVGGGVMGIYAAAAFLNYMQVPLPEVVHAFPGLAPDQPAAAPAKLDPVEVELDPVEVVLEPQPPVGKQAPLAKQASRPQPPPAKSDPIIPMPGAAESDPAATPVVTPAQRQIEILREYEAAQTPAAFRAVAVACLETCQRAVAAGDQRLALRLLTTGLASARKSEDTELVKQVTLRIIELQRKQK